MKSVIYHVNSETKKYFFSTHHCQDAPNSFVPVTNRYASKEEIRASFDCGGYKEIKNPNKKYQA